MASQDSQDIKLVTVKEEISDHITVEEHDIALALTTKLQENPSFTPNQQEGILQTHISNSMQNENPGIESQHESLDQENSKAEGSNSTLQFLALQVKKEFNLQDTEQQSSEQVVIENDATGPHHVTVKQETQMDVNAPYDFPNFRNTMMGGNNVMTVLGNVEACLEDLPVKCEIDVEDQADVDTRLHERYSVSDIKIESDFPTTDSHLTAKSSHLVPLDGVSHHQKLPLMKICKNENGISEVFQRPFENGYDTNQEEYITNGSRPYLNARLPATETFQLNSITGDVLTLEQQALGVVDPRPFQCPLCPKNYKTKHTLRKHLKVHETIEKNINSRINGISKCLQTKAKLRKLKEEKKVTAYSQNLTDLRRPPNKHEGYKCTCGEVFKRRTRMESCLRSHEYLQQPVVKCFTCITCKKQYKNKVDFLTHRQKMHRKKFPCKFCPTDYKSKSLLFRHLQIHQKVQLLEYTVISEVVAGKQELNCFLCSKFYTELSELKSHVMLDHKRPYNCPHCQNVFPKMHDFVGHIKTEHPNIKGHSVLDVLEAFSKLIKDWKCEECKVQFAEPDKLALHQMKNHNPDLVDSAQAQCMDCRRIFVSQKALTSHRRVHHNSVTNDENKELVDSIMCLECRKICKDINALTSHMRLHSQDRKFPCKFCGFRFATKEKRKTHEEIHTGDMKYVCFICEYQCSSFRKLKLHKDSKKHFDMQKYLLTGKSLEQESSSKADNTKPEKKKSKKSKHSNDSKKNKKDDKKDTDNEEIEDYSSSSEKEHTIKSAVCDICGKDFSSYSKMAKHKESHPFIEYVVDGEDKPERIFFK